MENTLEAQLAALASAHEAPPVVLPPTDVSDIVPQPSEPDAAKIVPDDAWIFSACRDARIEARKNFNFWRLECKATSRSTSMNFHQTMADWSEVIGHLSAK